MDTLEIHLLGRPLIQWHNRQVEGFVSEKALALFAYLVMRPANQARETLAGLFWGDMPAERARANLRMAVYNLQQLFPGYMEAGRLSVAFNREMDYWLDVERFEAAIEISTFNQIPAIEEALSLYQGDFMEGVFLDGSVELDNWLLGERSRLRQIALHGFHSWAGRLMDAGKFAKAIQAWRGLLRLEPWQEAGHQGLMLALARSGNYSAALMQYEVCCRLLADELHVDPMPETRHLYERIRLAHDLNSRHNLPTQPLPLIGREKELKSLEKYLADPQIRMITITGPGGVGKSRLAIQAAEGQIHTWLHGVWFVPLEALSSAESIPAAMGSSLRLAFHGKQPLKTQLLRFLQEREMLLVLDNFEHLLDGTELVAEILAQAPLVKILVTSRQRLRLREEHCFQLSGLEYPVPGSGNSGQASPAVQLFIEVAMRALNTFAPGELQNSAILRICETLEGLPLGIEMAASWVDRFQVEQIASSIEANLNSLVTSVWNMPERHQSLQAVFDQSWSSLIQAEKRALSRLSLFRDGFSIQEATSICGVSPKTLDSLVKKSLLKVATYPDRPDRYRLHATIRQFSYEQCLAWCDEPALREKYLAYCIRFAEEASLKLGGSDQAVWIERIEQEHSNLQQALEWCQEQEEFSNLGLKLCVTLSLFWELRGYFRPGLNWFRGLLEACKEPESDLKVQARVRSGRLAFLAGEFELARLMYEESMRLYHETQNSQGYLDALNGLVAVLIDQGEYQPAAEFGIEALELARRNGDPDKVAQATNNLGLLDWYRGDYASAQRYLDETLNLRRTTGNRPGIGYALNNLALVALDKDQPDEAVQLLEESLAIRRELGDRRGTAFVLGNLGITAQYQGDLKKAEAYLAKSLAIRRELGDWHFVAHTLANLGSVAQTQGKYRAARLSYDEGMEIARQLEVPLLIAFLSRGLGSLFSDLADFQSARPLLEESVRLERGMDAQRSLGIVLEKMAKLAYRMGDYEFARTIAEEAFELCTNTHSLRGIARAQLILGKLDAIQMQTSQARAHLDAACEIVRQTGNPVEIAAVLEGFVILASKSGRPENALALFKRANKLRLDCGAPLAPADQLELELDQSA